MKPRTPQMPKGIDVSHWQGNVDWRKVRASGISFAYLKATEGTNVVDDTFARNHQGCKANGILVGAYHFAHASNSPTTEAQHFCNTVRGYAMDLPLVLDIEIADGQSKQTIINYVTTFLNTVEAVLGKRVMIYAGGSFAKSYLTSFGQYPLWLAQYTTSTTPMSVPGFADWTMWQYSESGSVQGINGNVDVNVFNGTLEELKSLLYTLKPEIANAVISTYISPAWQQATTQADKDKAHNLANELRKASGQKTT